MSKRFFYLFLFFIIPILLSGCSTNPVTGDEQFTALMSPQAENEIGEQEHQKVVAEFGLYEDKALQSYVNEVGRKVVMNTERQDVSYRFFILDTPAVNAFALPGGYIYLTRGLMCLANSEAEIAAVLAHEAAHITARHGAERFSKGVVTAIGAVLLSAAIGDHSVAEALGAGTELYMKSYSRKQESQADEIGMRYLSAAGYDVRGMSIFLSFLQADSALENKMAGAEYTSGGADYFATHPATSERIQEALSRKDDFPVGGVINQEDYQRRIDGIMFGDSAAQGMVRGNEFIHPVSGFKFSVPEDYHMVNHPDKVVASAPNGSVIIFDMMPAPTFLSSLYSALEEWIGQVPEDAQQTEVNGMEALTTSLPGKVDGRDMTLRLMVIRFDKKTIARFMIAYPQETGRGDLNALKEMTYSFRHISQAEAATVRLYRLIYVKAQGGDTVESMAAAMVLQDGFAVERFRVLNGMGVAENVTLGQTYKIIVY